MTEWKVVFAEHLKMRRGADELYEHRHPREFIVQAPDRMAAIDQAEALLDSTEPRMDEDEIFCALINHGFQLEGIRTRTMPICEQVDPEQPAAS